MTKRCPRCGYRPSFWKYAHRECYYCRTCGEDLKPGKALFKPWKGRLYLLSAVLRVAALVSAFMAARLFLEMQDMEPTDLAQFDSAEAILHTQQLMQHVDELYIPLSVSMLSLALLLVLSTLVALPFDQARSRRGAYNGLLGRGPSKFARVILLISCGALMLLAGTMLFSPAFEEFFGLMILRTFASPFVLVMATLLIVWLHLRAVKASHQSLHPLQWNAVEKRFDEITSAGSASMPPDHD